MPRLYWGVEFQGSRAKGGGGTERERIYRGAFASWPWLHEKPSAQSRGTSLESPCDTSHPPTGLPGGEGRRIYTPYSTGPGLLVAISACCVYGTE